MRMSLQGDGIILSTTHLKSQVKLSSQNGDESERALAGLSCCEPTGREQVGPGEVLSAERGDAIQL